MNDRTIAEIATGAVRSVDDVTALCGAGSRCGGCHEAIERLLASSMTAVEVAR